MRLYCHETLNHFSQHNKWHHRKVLLRSFHWNGQFRVSPTDSNVGTKLYSLITSTTGKYCSVTFIEWLRLRISSTDSKVRTTLFGINSTMEKNYSVACPTMGFTPQNKGLRSVLHVSKLTPLSSLFSYIFS